LRTGDGKQDVDGSRGAKLTAATLHYFCETTYLVGRTEWRGCGFDAERVADGSVAAVVPTTPTATPALRSDARLVTMTCEVTVDGPSDG